MKLKNVNKISSGDIVVITKTSGIRDISIKVGDEYIFQRFHKMDPMSASGIYLSKVGSLDTICFSTSICKNIETKEKVRDKKLNELFR